MASNPKTAPKSKRSPAGKKKPAAQSTKKQPVTAAVKARINTFLDRRPHRSFRLTRRRDYQRSLVLPGYWEFTWSVARLLRQNKNTFLLLALVYVVMSALMMGLASQDAFTELQQNIAAAGQELYAGDWTALGTATVLTLSAIAGNVTPSLTEVQQIYAVLIGLLVWLTTVWLLRQRIAGHAVRLRDGLYSAGAPLVATMIVALVVVVQLLPVALAMIGFSAAQATGLLAGGVEAMLFWAVALGLTTLSVYWITASAVAMVVVTLPGMYPFKALKIAGDMVVGRRLRMLYRLAWMALLLVISWVVVLIPIILIDMGVKTIWPAVQWVPTVPFVMTILTTVSVIWMASYVYVLYRKIVDDDTKPA